VPPSSLHAARGEKFGKKPDDHTRSRSCDLSNRQLISICIDSPRIRFGPDAPRTEPSTSERRTPRVSPNCQGTISQPPAPSKLNLQS
jgi:hypothetical protein